MKKLRLIALLVMICLLAAPAALAELKGGDLFVDPASGAAFTVPVGWQQFNLEVTADYTYVSFEPENGNLSPGLVSFYSADISNANPLPIEGTAEILGVSVDELEIMTYDGVEFYTCVTKNYDLGEEMQSFSALAYHNGYLFSVDFMGPDGSHMPAALELLSSLQF